ncbi:MAG: MBL fold metallo-hydrolase [Gemmatimonadaceae bacterium]|nr:MBL fold metallo-hydrolase [Gemmatimonadaceae bacterium]
MIAATPSTETVTLGRLRLHAIQAGGQKLDGGAMFGVVPKPLWEKRIPADERNRIGLGMRCLLVEHEDGLVLIDTGLGNKENAKFRDIYGVDNAGAGGATWLEDAIVGLGFALSDVRTVINTHLHFDHAGGNTRLLSSGEVVPTFPKARYVAHRGEHHWATHTNERTAASYFGQNWEPLIAAGQLELVDGTKEVVPGISMVATPGHTPHHQSILVDGGNGGVACFLADVCPTTAHVPLPWIMGYDVEPLVTLESKRRLWPRAAAEGWLLVFEHDASVASSRLRAEGKGWALVP